MRRFILLFFIAALIAGCATTYYDSAGNPVPKEKMEQLRMEAVRAHLGEHRYRISWIECILCVVHLSI